jgi:hypothetical protein
MEPSEWGLLGGMLYGTAAQVQIIAGARVIFSRAPLKNGQSAWVDFCGVLY